jgi:PKD repeat protein
MGLLSLLVSYVSRSSFAAIGLLLAAAFGAACEKVPLLAPTESTVVLTVNTTTVPVNGTAEVIATVIESAGTAAHNGTSVYFTSSFGTMEPAEGRTQGGRAVAIFRAGQQSGTAVIGASSGSARAENIELKVGGAAAGAIVVRAEARAVGVADIIATVVDAAGNPLPGVPVTFSTTAGQLSPGQAVTGSNGEAQSTLSTSREATVTARAGEQEASVTVSATGPTVTITVPTTIEAGIPATFRVAPPAGTTLSSVSVNWGDGTPATQLGTLSADTPVVHTFLRAGVFTVTATSTDAQGLTGTSQAVVNVTEQAGIPITLSATPNPVSRGGLVTFTASAGGLGGSTGAISSYSWDFGDGQGAITTGSTINHSYTRSETYIASVTVRSTTGQQGFAQITIRVN